MARHQRDTSLDEIARSLTSPGGITAHGLAGLAEADALGAWSRALDSVLTRMRADPVP